jgi:hypothetical protein
VYTVVRLAFVPVLVLTLGLHWALLQSVAWTGMIITYSQENPLPVALRMTFDGNHPCPMCKAIKEGRAQEKQQEKIAPVNQLPLAIIWQAPRFCFDNERPLISPLDSTFSTHADAPPKPRPKVFSSFSLA